MHRPQCHTWHKGATDGRLRTEYVGDRVASEGLRASCIWPPQTMLWQQIFDARICKEFPPNLHIFHSFLYIKKCLVL